MKQGYLFAITGATLTALLSIAGVIIVKKLRIGHRPLNAAIARILSKFIRSGNTAMVNDLLDIIMHLKTVKRVAVIYNHVINDRSRFITGQIKEYSTPVIYRGKMVATLETEYLS